MRNTFKQQSKLGARQASCRLIHAAICCLSPMATTAVRSGLRGTAVMCDQSRVRPVSSAQNDVLGH